MEPLLAEIRMFAGNYAPRGWAFCDGSLLSISQNSALFSLLGTTYGGNGQTTFALPDFRGRLPMHPGQGPGLTPRALGERGGAESVTLSSAQLAPHTHALNASGQQGDGPVPDGAVWAVSVDPNTGVPLNSYGTTPTTAMSPQALGMTGDGLPHPNVQPYLCVNFIIALEGIYPSRS